MITADITGRRRLTTRMKAILCMFMFLHTLHAPTDCLDPSPLVMKVRSRASSVMSGASTPGGGKSNSLSEGDLRKADAALSQVNGVNGVNGSH